jgi:hypothetical protein
MSPNQAKAASLPVNGKPKRRIVWWTATVVMLLLAFGCYSYVSVLWKSTAQFVPLASDVRVRYEPGAEGMAQMVAQALPLAIRTIEAQQYAPFVKPVTVYVYASLESFQSYGLSVGYAGGFVFNQRLFLSPKPENTAERIPRLLTHELSHLHLEQRLGLLRWNSAIPAWFQEGLAVHVSGGGGAENVSEGEAREAIADGRHFVPEATGHLLFRKGVSVYRLQQHMFYRPSGMFVAHLKQRDEAQFKALLLAVQERESLQATFQSAYGSSLEMLW